MSQDKTPSYASAGSPSSFGSGDIGSPTLSKLKGTNSWKFGGTPSTGTTQTQASLKTSKQLSKATSKVEKAKPAFKKRFGGGGAQSNQLSLQNCQQDEEASCCCENAGENAKSSQSVCHCGGEKICNNPNFTNFKEVCSPQRFDAFPNPFRAPKLRTPGWLAHGGRVLRYFAFYQESIPESNQENYRIHKCEIRFFPEDGTMEVIEPKTLDPGYPQGRVVKRHRIPMPPPCDEDSVYTLEDLEVGCEIMIYGKNFFLTGVDARTREYLNRVEGRPVMKNLEMPEDPYTLLKKDQLQSLFSRKAAINLDHGKFKKFLDKGGKVLRFWAYWDDRCNEDRLRRFVFHYFLEDDCVEIKEIVDPNGGISGATAFLGKGKLLKNHKDLVNVVGIREEALLILNTSAGKHYSPDTPIVNAFLTDKLCPGIDEKEFITDKDLCIGAVLNVYGRAFILTECDKATQVYYREKYGIEDFTPLVLEQSEVRSDPPRMPVPPHTGIGDEADTAYNWERMEPVPPPVDLLAKLIGDKDILYFEARFDQPIHKVNEDRRFTIKIYMIDNTVSIIENPHPNTGFQGQFLARSKFRRRRPNYELGEESEYYVTSDYYVGNTLDINGFRFLLTDTNEFTYAYMERRAPDFPHANFCFLIEKVRETVGPIEGEALFRACAQNDVKLMGIMSPEDFRTLLIQVSKGSFSEHEITTLTRGFRINGKPQVDFETLKAAIQGELQRYNMDTHLLSRIEYTLRYHDPCRSGHVDRETLRATLKGALRPVNRLLIDYLVDKFCIVDNCDRINYCELLHFMDWIRNPAHKMTPSHIACILKWLEPKPPKGKVFCVNYRAFLETVNPSAICDFQRIFTANCNQEEPACSQEFPRSCLNLCEDTEEEERCRAGQVISDNKIKREELRCSECCPQEQKYYWNTPRMSQDLANAYMPQECEDCSDIYRPSGEISYEDLYTRPPIHGEFQLT